jgi:hypothetical protein
MNDFDKLFPITTYRRIKDKLGLFFQRVDKAFNSHYYDELCGYVVKEEAERAEKAMEFPPKDECKGVSEDSTQEANAKPVTKQVEVMAAATKETAPDADSVPSTVAVSSAPIRSAGGDSAQKSHPLTPEVWAALANGTSPYCRKDASGKPMAYIGIPGMSDAEKAWVRGVFDDGSFDWLPEAGELLESHESRFLTPAKVKIDPLDGRAFD